MSSSEEQLVSFFAYSFFVYPVTNWLIQPKKITETKEDGTIVEKIDKSPATKWKQVLLAILFLSCISILHLSYENMDKGPNHYVRLGVTRDSLGSSAIKKSYRTLSRTLHPDKNKAEGAVEEFRKVKYAFDVLNDNDLRRTYERLGDAGVKTASQHAIDHQHIMTQMVVYYASSLILAFLMTFSGSNGAFEVTVFGLIVTMFIEVVLVLEEWTLPYWLFPYTTAADVVSILRRLFPAFMNGTRGIIEAFNEDNKGARIHILTQVSTTMEYISQKMSGALLTFCSDRCNSMESSSSNNNSNGVSQEIEGIKVHGVMNRMMHSLNQKENKDKYKDSILLTQKRALLCQDPMRLKMGTSSLEHSSTSSSNETENWLITYGRSWVDLFMNDGALVWVRNLFIYILIRYYARKFIPGFKDDE